MSWNTQSPGLVKPDSPPEEILPNPPYEVNDETKEQVALARRVAQMILQSGAVGSSDRLYRVTASGHANPGHKPTPAWANDAITVSVAQDQTPAPADGTVTG